MLKRITSLLLLLTCGRSDLRQAMAGLYAVIHAIDLFETSNLFKCFLAERRFPRESVEGDPFKQVAKRNIQVLRQPFEYLDHPLLHPHSGLNALDHNLLI